MATKVSAKYIKCGIMKS